MEIALKIIIMVPDGWMDGWTDGDLCKFFKLALRAPLSWIYVVS